MADLTPSDHLGTMAASISSFIPSTWPKALLLLYLVLNLKSLPFIWHLRICYHFLTNIHRRPTPPPRLFNSRNNARKILTHPLFHPISLTSHTPFLEADYNLHKSNSTYLMDMDISRTKLFAPLFSPGFRHINTDLEKQGHSKKAKLFVALGGVHLNFRRELGMYERFEVRSRVIGWDAKWIIILSCFVRTKGRDKKEELCAVGLSKYVVKKGRFTVPPDMVFRKAGWLPTKVNGDQRSDSVERVSGVIQEKTEGTSDLVYQPGISAAGREQEGKLGPRERIEEADDGLKRAQLPAVAQTAFIMTSEKAAAVIEEKTTWDAEAWNWEEIEEERLRGLRLAKGWMALDSDLCAESEGF